jgi:hypothetical protein
LTWWCNKDELPDAPKDSFDRIKKEFAAIPAILRELYGLIHGLEIDIADLRIEKDAVSRKLVKLNRLDKDIGASEKAHKRQVKEFRDRYLEIEGRLAWLEKQANHLHSDKVLLHSAEALLPAFQVEGDSADQPTATDEKFNPEVLLPSAEEALAFGKDIPSPFDVEIQIEMLRLELATLKNRMAYADELHNSRLREYEVNRSDLMKITRSDQSGSCLRNLLMRLGTLN